MPNNQRAPGQGAKGADVRERILNFKFFLLSAYWFFCDFVFAVGGEGRVCREEGVCVKIFSTKHFFGFLNLVSEGTGRLTFGGALARSACGIENSIFFFLF